MCSEAVNQHDAAGNLVTGFADSLQVAKDDAQIGVSRQIRR
jgi:hypothetical protein